MKKVTIRDVAAAAGCSVSAVSYILNGSDKKKYSEATVKAVKKAAERLHYSPNAIARGMRSQKAHAIGIVNFWEANNATFAPVLRAIAEEAAKTRVSTVLCTGESNFSYISAVSDRAVDGIILFAPAALPFSERGHIREMQKMGVRFVIVNGAVRSPDVFCAYFDYYAASAFAVRRFVDAKKTRILYVDEFSEAAAKELRERREGYVDTMRELGLAPLAEDLATLTKEDLSGIEAIVTSRSETARALLRRLLEWGIKVPEQIEILSGCGEEEGKESFPPLSAVDFDRRALGEFAVSAVMGDKEPSCLCLGPIYRKGETAKV